MYLVSNNISFADWLISEMNQLGWSQSDLAREAGLGRGVINKITNHINKKPDPETCKAIARGLRMSPITVFIAAGLLPPMPERSSDFDDLDTIYADLRQEKRKELLVIARALLEADRS
jgi:transcriptional regulator with XRE-family HTH domain